MLPLGLFVVLYIVWTLYLAIMSLKRARNAGMLTTASKVLGYPLLYIGVALNVFGNIVIASLILVEPPREWAISDRVKRWYHFAPVTWLERYRVTIATWVAVNLLNAFDPSGPHV